jgi:hypothetical protein
MEIKKMKSMEELTLTEKDLESLTYISNKFSKIRQLGGSFDDLIYFKELMLNIWSEKNRAFKHVISIL